MRKILLDMQSGLFAKAIQRTLSQEPDDYQVIISEHPDKTVQRCKTFKPYTADGKNYLYIGQQYPDDCWAFEIFDLSKGTLRKVDTVYAVTVKSDPHSYDEQGIANLFVPSGGADEPRPIKLRQAKGGKWYLWEQYLLSGIRQPESSNPWA